MIFRRKKPNRLYYPTKSRWYRKPRKKPAVRSSRRLFSYNMRTRFTRAFKDFFLYVVAILVFLALILFLLFSNKFSVSDVSISRDDLHVDSGAVSDLLEDYVGRSILFVSKQQIRNLIQENYPEFASVKVRKVLPGTLQVDLETHEIVANIRAFYTLPKVEEPELSVEEKELAEFSETLRQAFNIGDDQAEEEKEEVTPIEQRGLLNRIGQALFDREEDLQLMTITVEGLTQPIEDREIVIPLKAMDFILNSVKYLTNLMQMEVESVRYLPVAREVHLRIKDGPLLWLSYEKDYREQIDRLNTIYKVAELDKEDLAYIDLRIKEKVIYCPKRSSCDR